MRVFDDFAHHPTAIEATLGSLAAEQRSGRLIALIEPRSNTMRMGEHRDALAASTVAADRVYWYQPAGMDWSLDDVVAGRAASVHSDIDALVTEVAAFVAAGDDVVIMSNGGFENIHQRLLQLDRIDLDR